MITQLQLINIIIIIKVRQVRISDLRVSNWHMWGSHDFFFDNKGKTHPVCALKAQHFSSNAENFKGKFVPVNAMKAQRHSFQTPVLDASEFLTSRPVTLLPGKETAGHTEWEVKWTPHPAWTIRRRQNPLTCRQSNPRSPSPHPSHYTTTLPRASAVIQIRGSW